MMGPDWGHGWGGMGWSGMAWMLLLWVLLIACAVLLVRWLLARNTAPGERPAQQTALDILKQRYARGELDRESFEHMRRDIES